MANVFLFNAPEFPAVTVCNMNKHRVSALTQRDIVFVGPLLGITDESYYLHHSEHYNQTWVHDMFASTDWRALKGKCFAKKPT